MVVIHFYSGFRREGDLHHLLQHATLAPGLELFVISVDLCLQKAQRFGALSHLLADRTQWSNLWGRRSSSL